MQVFNNIDCFVKDDIAKRIKKGSKISIAAACFSIYAYQALQKQLNSIDELKFIFTSPTFIKEKTPKEKKEFFIPRLNRERCLCGTEFEVKLRNELKQKAIARECSEWIRKKVRFYSNMTNENMAGFMNISNQDGNVTYLPLQGFTTADIGCVRGNNAYNVITMLDDASSTREYMRLFDSLWLDKGKVQDVTDMVIDSISVAYKENSPDFIYFMTLYNIFNEFLEDISEDVLPNEATGFKNSIIWGMLYDFQKDAALAIINKLEQYNGCILADSVGLGKTFTALAVIKYYENRNKSVLVLCPKKLSENWNTYKSNYLNNPIAKDRLRYDVLYHTDLSREYGQSNGIDLERLNWSNYDLVVIDESHNFRNGGILSGEDEKENRYLRLMNKVIRAGVKTKVLMLSATPVNNRFNDLKNQLALAYEGDSTLINDKLDASRPIDEIFRNAQRTFNAWSKLSTAERTTEALLKSLDFDFFQVLDNVTIARSRKHIEKYYGLNGVGKFPERLKPISVRPHLTDLPNAITYNDIYQVLNSLNLRIYTPSDYILPTNISKYTMKDQKTGLTQHGREQGIRRLMSINLLKRLESSVYSFRLTLLRIKTTIDDTINLVEQFKLGNRLIQASEIREANEFDDDDLNTELFSVGNKVKINLSDMDYLSWQRELKLDSENLDLLINMIEDITPEHDSKLQSLHALIDNKMENPINSGNKKILIFTAFSDTADYLYKHVSQYMKQAYGLNTAEITGSVDGKSTIPDLRSDLNTVLTCFSPISKDKDMLMPNDHNHLDILVATDCISEGQNLQDCDYVINYDIHWNPVRIIQRFGRVDRIGSKNARIQLVNFWPDLTLDDYINLKARVETRMKISVMTSTGDDNPLSEEEKGELEYRKQQLKRLQEEVVDIEDMSNGISIMDLGLNEFRLDLLDYMKRNHDIETAPHGMHAVVEATDDAPAGVIYVMRNVNDSVNIDHQNLLHPFYMVYISDDGEVICDHLSPKMLLDKMRLLCKGHTEPEEKLYSVFNKETKDGKNMVAYSQLLSEVIDSIIQVKEESDLDSFFQGKPMSFLDNQITGLDNFELICFLVVK